MGKARSKYLTKEMLPVPIRSIAGKSPMGVAAPPRLQATITMEKQSAMNSCVVPRALRILSRTGRTSKRAVRLFNVQERINIMDENMMRIRRYFPRLTREHQTARALKRRLRAKSDEKIPNPNRMTNTSHGTPLYMSPMRWFPSVAARVTATVAPLRITIIFLAGIRAWMIKVATITVIRTAPVIFCPVPPK